MFDLVIKDGILVTSTAAFKADIGVQGEKITAIAPGLSGKEVISAQGMLVLPGGVDPHVHLEMPTATTITSETWETGSRAAAFGGTTTVIDFVEPANASQPLMDAFRERLSQAQGKSSIDFGFHMTLISADEAIRQQLPEVFRAGMASYKVYTTYPGFYLQDHELTAIFEMVQSNQGLVMVHAESDHLIRQAAQHLQTAGQLSIPYFPESRPAQAEVEAVKRVIQLAAAAHAPVYFVHISTAGAANAVAQAQKDGLQVLAETCPQYLLLDEELIKLNASNGARFICCPPLRTKNDQDALWGSLNHSIQSIGTDHCTFNANGQKDVSGESFLDVPSGLPGIELRMALIYTFGVKTGKLTLPEWVSLCCATPAKIFGLHPRKGELLPGSDADIVIFDPHSLSTIHITNLHENVDYSPYEGLELAGKVHTTLLRGKVLVQDGNWVGQQHTGVYLPCSSYLPG